MQSDENCSDLPHHLYHIRIITGLIFVTVKTDLQFLKWNLWQLANKKLTDEIKETLRNAGINWNTKQDLIK